MLVGDLVAIFYFPRNIGFLIIPIDGPHFSEGWPNHQPVMFLRPLGMVWAHDARNSRLSFIPS